MNDKRRIKFSLRYKITMLIFTLVVIFTVGITWYSWNLNVQLQEKNQKKHTPDNQHSPGHSAL